MKTKCFSLELLYKYTDKELDSDKINEIESHIKNCPTCKSIIKQISCIDENLSTVFAREKIPVGFEQKFYSRLSEPKIQKPFFSFARIAMLAGASAAVLLIIFSANQTGILTGSKEVKNTQIEKKIINKVASDALNYL